MFLCPPPPPLLFRSQHCIMTEVKSTTAAVACRTKWPRSSQPPRRFPPDATLLMQQERAMTLNVRNRCVLCIETTQGGAQGAILAIVKHFFCSYVASKGSLRPPPQPTPRFRFFHNRTKNSNQNVVCDDDA